MVIPVGRNGRRRCCPGKTTNRVLSHERMIDGQDDHGGPVVKPEQFFEAESNGAEHIEVGIDSPAEQSGRQLPFNTRGQAGKNRSGSGLMEALETAVKKTPAVGKPRKGFGSTEASSPPPGENQSAESSHTSNVAGIQGYSQAQQLFLDVFALWIGGET